MQENSHKYKTDEVRRVLVEELPSDEELLIRNLPNKNYIWTLRKNGVKEEVYFSSSVKDVTGYSPKEYFELPGNGVELVEKTDLPEYKKQLAKLEDEESNEIEITYRIKTRAGEIKWIKEQIRKEFKDDLQILYGFVTDVTNFKEREEKLEKRSDDLNQLNIAKDNFISILSHDLRAPFTSILGFSEILKNENSLSEDEKIEYLNYIHGSSENQLQLINYLLDWSRLQTGRMKMEITRVHVPLVVFNCVSSLTGNAVRKNIDIKVDVDNSIYVEADERLLSQIVTNLLSNAIKFSPNGKNIEIRVSVFNDDFIEFTIKDEGIGIPEKHKDKLFRFDKMFTTEGTRGEKGTGLGLPLVKEIIEKHKGQIWFYSKEHNGSEFHFTIPNATNTILIVENNIDERMLFENIIRDKYPTFRVVGADNGYDAINLVYLQHPALIIASHEMPLMSGIQFIRSLKRKDKNFNTPVIVLVETQNENIEKTYQEFGVRKVISKPVDLLIFNETLSELLNQNKFNL